MSREEFFMPSKDGQTKLHGYVWTPDGEPAAVLQLVHGMSEYIGRYDAFARYLNSRGIAAIGHDHLGHGQSVTEEGRLGYFADRDGDELLDLDIHAVTEKAKETFPGKPVFILGHSMGSFLVRRHLTRYSGEFAGAIVMGTGNVPAALAGVGVGLSKTVAALRGRFHRSGLLAGLALGSNNKPFRPNRTDFDWLSVNTENVDRYIADPLCGFNFTAGAFIDFFTFIKKVGETEDADRIRKDLPVLVVSGELDPVGGKAAVEQVSAGYKTLGLADVEAKIYTGDRHEILNEDDRETVYRDLAAWILARI